MKKILLSVIILGILVSFTGYSQTLDWAFKIGGSQNDVAEDILKDSLGNIYMTGGISGTVNMNPVGTPVIVNAGNTNYSNLFLAKYNKDFRLIWVVTIDQESTGAKLLVDDSLNVYVLGSGSGSYDFDPTTGTRYFDCSPSNSFIAKYDRNGNFLAVNAIPALGYYPPNSKIFIDKQNHLFTYSNDTLIKFNKGLQPLWENRIEGNPVFFNQQDFVLIKNFKHWFNPDGNSVANMIYESRDNISGTSTHTQLYGDCDFYIGMGFLTKTKSDKLIIKARYWGKLTLYGNNDTISFTNKDMIWSPYGGYHIGRDFIALYDTTHNLIWAKDFPGGSPNPYLIETDEKGNIYTLGFLNFSANFNPDGQNLLTNSGYSNYIAKYDSSLNYLAAAQFLGGSYMEQFGAFKLANTTALICGCFYNTIDLDLTPSRYSLSSQGVWDIFVAQYSDFDIVSDVTSIVEFPDNPIRIYPNPTKGILNFSGLSKPVDVKIYSTQGILLRTVNNFEISMDISDLSPGVYLILVSEAGLPPFRTLVIKE
ncbi:MAG: T9SS type A sorting domain-containing protein [Bacteroidales bacterium]